MEAVSARAGIREGIFVRSEIHRACIKGYTLPGAVPCSRFKTQFRLITHRAYSDVCISHCKSKAVRRCAAKRASRCERNIKLRFYTGAIMGPRDCFLLFSRARI